MGARTHKGRGVLSPHAPLAPYLDLFGRSFKRRGSSATQSRVSQIGYRTDLRLRAKAGSQKHQTATTEVMTHALSSEALRRERAPTRESERVFTKLTL
jgi:hypothetical protein